MAFNEPPWIPISDPTDIKYLGKLIEELGEGVSALARTLIQGIDSAEPNTNKLNRQWVFEELIDIQVNIDLVAERFEFNFIVDGLERYKEKKINLRSWHNNIQRNNY